MFEGTGKYFLILFLIFFVVYITVKISLYHIFKSAKIPGYKALIPFYNRLVLVKALELDNKIFYKTLIPFVNLYYYYIIIKKLLVAYNLNPKEAILFILIPMYKFPELVFKKPRFVLNMYNETEQFLENQAALFSKEETVSELPIENSINKSNEMVINPTSYNQIVSSGNLNNGYIQNSTTPNNGYIQNSAMSNNQIASDTPQSNDIFSSNYVKPDERQETYFEAKKTVQKEETPIVVADTGRPKICPNCHAKLTHNATVCFLCGTKLDK